MPKDAFPEPPSLFDWGKGINNNFARYSALYTRSGRITANPEATLRSGGF
jgi:hypothetical protein